MEEIKYLFPAQTAGSGFVNDPMTFLLPVEADLTQIPLSLQGDVSCTLLPGDLCAVSVKTSVDTSSFSYRTHFHSDMYFVKELLCSHTLSFIVHLELD